MCWSLPGGGSGPGGVIPESTPDRGVPEVETVFGGRMNMPQQRQTRAIWVGALILVLALAASWAAVHWLGLFPTRIADLTAPSLLHAILLALVVIALAVGTVIVRRGREVRFMEARLRSILDSTLDAVAVIDRQSRILLANTQFEKIFGYNRREVTGQPIQKLIAKHPQ